VPQGLLVLLDLQDKLDHLVIVDLVVPWEIREVWEGQGLLGLLVSLETLDLQGQGVNLVRKVTLGQLVHQVCKVPQDQQVFLEIQGL